MVASCNEEFGPFQDTCVSCSCLGLYCKVMLGNAKGCCRLGSNVPVCLLVAVNVLFTVTVFIPHTLFSLKPADGICSPI